MADDLPKLIEAANALRTETNTALGRLTPRNARRVHEPLCAEREATNRLVAALMAKIKDTQAFVKWFNETRH